MSALVSTLLISISGALLGALLFRWIPRPSRQALSSAFSRSLKADAWTSYSVLLLETASSAILDSSRTRRKALVRCFVFGTALLVFVLGVTGLISGQVLGVSDWPWNQFDQELSRLEWSARGEKDAARWVEVIQAVRGGPWKFIYAAIVLPLVLVVTCLFFWISLRTARFFGREAATSHSWTQRSGVMLGLCVVVLLLANVLVFAVSALSSALPWLLLASSIWSLSAPLLLAGGVAFNVFSLYVSDPWTKGVLLTSLFPVIVQLTITIPSMAIDLARSAVLNTTKKVGAAAPATLKQAFVPYLMIAASGYFAYRFLRALL